MLSLRDFFQIKQAEPAFNAVTAAGPGLIVVSGPEGQPLNVDDEGMPVSNRILPSGRAMVFRTLVDEILDHHPDSFGILVSRGGFQYRSGRAGRRRLRELLVDPTNGLSAGMP